MQTTQIVPPKIQAHNQSKKHKSKNNKSQTNFNPLTCHDQKSTFPYFRYNMHTIKHIERDQDQVSQPNKLKAQLVQPLKAQEDKCQNQSFRYFRYKTLTIKHIDKDQQDSPQQICFEPQTCMSTTFYQPPSEPISEIPEQSSSKEANKRQFNNSKNIIQKSQPGINFKWQFKREKYLSQKCTENLKKQKAQVYSKLVKFFEFNLKRQSKKNILYLYGEKQTGKKTLLCQVLNSNLFACRTFYLNFSTPSQKHKQQTLHFYKELRRNCQIQAKNQQEIKIVLVINNVQIFIHFLKKMHIFHEFRSFMKIFNPILVLIDRVPLDNKQFSWIAQNSQVLYVPKNSKNLFLSCLVDYFTDYKSSQGEIIFPKSLANYFTVKLYQEDCLQFGIIHKFALFILNSLNPQKIDQIIQNGEANIKTIKITRQLIETFKKSTFGNKCTVQLEHLSLHQKMILIACYVLLTENELIGIPFSQIEKNYKWICASMSIQPKNTKQLLRDIVHNLETYRLLKLLHQFGKSKQKHIFLSIDLSKINEELSVEPFQKFFRPNSNEQE